VKLNHFQELLERLEIETKDKIGHAEVTASLFESKRVGVPSPKGGAVDSGRG
jgi:hypothetical protein